MLFSLTWSLFTPFVNPVLLRESVTILFPLEVNEPLNEAIADCSVPADYGVKNVDRARFAEYACRGVSRRCCRKSYRWQAINFRCCEWLRQ